MRYKSMLSSLRKVIAEKRDLISDSKVLWLLNLVAKNEGMPYSAMAKRRIAFHRAIANCAEDGKIAIIFNGMDCDGVKYEGDVTIVDADWRKIDSFLDHHYEWVDGPCYHYLERPSVAENCKYSSRDLMLEAFEDGHSHVLYI